MKITATPGQIDLTQLKRIHAGRVQVELTPSAWESVMASTAIVEEAALGDIPVYGINTGFSKLASTRIDVHDLGSYRSISYVRTAWALANLCEHWWYV